MISIMDAILALDADAQVVVNGKPSDKTEYEANVKYISGKDKNGNAIYKNTQDFTWAQVSAKKTELQTAYDNNAYQRKRKEEYLSWNEQLDLLWHDINDGKLDKTGSWYKHIKAVKDANSKE